VRVPEREPRFSAGEPWCSVCEASGHLASDHPSSPLPDTDPVSSARAALEASRVQLAASRARLRVTYRNAAWVFGIIAPIIVFGDCFCVSHRVGVVNVIYVLNAAVVSLGLGVFASLAVTLRAVPE
jgi:small basic protein